MIKSLYLKGIMHDEPKMLGFMLLELLLMVTVITLSLLALLTYFKTSHYFASGMEQQKAAWQFAHQLLERYPNISDKSTTYKSYSFQIKKERISLLCDKVTIAGKNVKRETIQLTQLYCKKPTLISKAE